MLVWARILGSSVVRFVARLPRAVVWSASALLAIVLAWACSSHSSNSGPSFPTPLFPQVQLDGANCIPKFAVPLPVFGPAGSIPRVDAAAHPNLTVTMKEIDQQILPQITTCGVKLGPTRVWAFETSDANTGAVLGPAHFPAVTIVAQRGTATQMEYVNQLPSFNYSNPGGPGLLQRLLPVDQTIHWADPLQSGCAMQPPTTDPNAPCRQQYLGPVPATVHLHGAEIPAEYDGDPESWFTPNGLKGADYHSMGNPKPGHANYEYPNAQEPGTLWFHDHALGTTRLNVYAGLAGFYFLKDQNYEPQGYPSGAQEIEMAVQDRMFDKNSQALLLNQQTSNNHPFWAPGFEGDVATVNGAAFPYLNVEPRRYRFHILNGSLNRGYEFVFGGAPVYLVGADDNLFDQPVPADPNGVPVSPAERVDIIVDFTNFAGQNLEVTNSRAGQYIQLNDIMEFKVSSTVKSTDTSCDPTNPDPSSGLCARQYPMVHLTDGKGNIAPGVKVDRVRQLVLYDYVEHSGGTNPNDIIEYVNGTKWNGLESAGIAKDFPSDGVSELPRVGSIEEWDIVYLSTMAMASHPVHVHLSQFQVLNRQAIMISDPNTNDNSKDDPSKYYLAAWLKAYGTDSGCAAGAYCLNYGPPLDYLSTNTDGAIGGNPAFSPYFTKDINGKVLPTIPPRPSESGWKDTADAFSNQVLRILVRWTPSDVPITPNTSYAGENFYQFDPTKGYYVWHCHVLTHEDNEMMRPYRVVP